LRAEQGWTFDLDALQRLLRPQTRLVAVNLPNNPTGAMPDRETFRELVDICADRGIRLFSDEVFRGLELDPTHTLPQAADLSPTALSLNVMSKSYGLPGLRIGWLACRDRAVLERLERRKHYTSICNAGPSEHLAVIALGATERIHARNRAIIAENLPIFDDFFAAWPERFEWQHPQGGCVSFPRLVTGEPTSTFCRRLVERAGVVVLPADIFSSRLFEVPTDRFRIGVGRRESAAALQAFDQFLRADTRKARPQ
jgi:aspartate/methionine/tyrosine aminotransferase